MTAGDIAALQALYGSRAPDPHEGSGGNDRIDTATTIQAPGGSGSYTGATPLIAYGDITTNQDVDFYAFKAPNDYTGPVTIQLRSAGISLLNPHLTLLDASGNVLGDVQSTSDFGDVVTLHLDHVDPNANYYLEVQGATGDVFGIGGYGVAVTFDANSTVTSAAIDAVLRGPYQSLSPNDINAIFLGAADPLFNSTNHANDTPGTATQLDSFARIRAKLSLRDGREPVRVGQPQVTIASRRPTIRPMGRPWCSPSPPARWTSTGRPRGSRSSTATARSSPSRSSPTAPGCSPSRPVV